MDQVGESVLDSIVEYSARSNFRDTMECMDETSGRFLKVAHYNILMIFPMTARKSIFIQQIWTSDLTLMIAVDEIKPNN